MNAHVVIENGQSQVYWIQEHDRRFIHESNIAVDGERIAWFQSSWGNQHLLRVYEKENSQYFSWKPITQNPFFGCYCILIEWYKDHLIFIYQEKHGIYICAVRDNNVRHFKFHGEEIERKGDLISYETYMGKTPDSIKLIKIPELILQEPIGKEEAEKRGLVPRDLNRPGNFLGQENT